MFCDVQTTASEATFVALLAARTEAIRKYRARDPTLDDAEINARLVAYCSDQARTRPTLLLARSKGLFIFYVEFEMSVSMSLSLLARLSPSLVIV